MAHSRLSTLLWKEKELRVVPSLAMQSRLTEVCREREPRICFVIAPLHLRQSSMSCFVGFLFVCFPFVLTI